MKKLLIGLIIAAAATGAVAQHHGHYNRGYGHNQPHHNHGGWGWAVPAIIGGAVIYGIARAQDPQPVVIQQQPVVIQQPTGCPVGTVAIYNKIIVIDNYNRSIEQYQLAGCRQ